MTPPGPSSPPAGAALPVTSWRPPATRPASSPPPRPADQQSARTPVTTTANAAHTCPGCSHATQQAPRRARKGLPASRLGKDTRRPSSSPQRTSRGPRGVLPGARQGHTPTKRDPKMEIGVQVCRALPRPPFCVRCPLDRGAVRLSQVWVGCPGFSLWHQREIRGAGREGSGERRCSPPVLL